MLIQGFGAELIENDLVIPIVYGSEEIRMVENASVWNSFYQAGVDRVILRPSNFGLFFHIEYDGDSVLNLSKAVK